MDRAPELIIKYLRGEITPAEQQELEAWLSISEYNRDVFAELIDPDKVSAALKQQEKFNEDTAWTTVSGRIGNDALATRQHTVHSMWRYVAAAAILVLLVVGGYVFWTNNTHTGVDSTMQGKDVAAGGNKAVLTLADGSVIVLDSAADGLLGQQGNVNIIKLDNGQLAYQSEGEKHTRQHEPLYNTISTPRGGQYQIVLPDGSRVWLNAASSLRFPAVFDGEERLVELKGEAYFDVTPVQSGPSGTIRTPFKVIANGAEVQVLGTEFNVNAYTEENSVRTTLVRGAVKVSASNGKDKDAIVLKPGEQVLQQEGDHLTLVDNANIEQAIAWKNGYFDFDKADIKTVMRQLERWYDLEVEYKGTIPMRRFMGGMQRSLPLSKVLNILKDNNVKFEINGRKITLL